MIQNKRDRTFFIFHILLLIEILFLAVSLGPGDSYALPYPTTSAVIKYIIILLTISGLLLYTRKIQMKHTSVVLALGFLIRIIIEIPNMAQGQSLDSEIKYLFTLIASLFVVIIYSKNWRDEKKRGVLKSLVATFLVIALQTILTFVMTFRSMAAYWGLKDRLHLPIGSSNFVECWILMLTSFLFYRDNKRDAWRIALFLVGFISALCTRSKVAILIWGIWFIVIFLKSYFKPRLKNILLIAVVLGAMYYVYRLLESINFFEYSTNVLLDLFSFDSANRRAAFNGRIELYRGAYESFTYSTKTLLIGSGRSYSAVSGIAHNYILDVLATSGIIGLIAVIIQYVSVFSFLIKNRKLSGCSKAALIMICLIIMNSMYEPCIDDYCFNVLYWMIISLGLQQTNLVRAA